MENFNSIIMYLMYFILFSMYWFQISRGISNWLNYLFENYFDVNFSIDLHLTVFFLGFIHIFGFFSILIDDNLVSLFNNSNIIDLVEDISIAQIYNIPNVFEAGYNASALNIESQEQLLILIEHLLNNELTHQLCTNFFIDYQNALRINPNVSFVDMFANFTNNLRLQGIRIEIYGNEVNIYN